MLPATGTLLHWVSEYGYPFLGGLLLLGAAGAPIPIELVLVALGALSATDGGPSFVALLAVGIVATVAGDLLDYAAGRLFGRTVVERWVRGMWSRSGRRGGAGQDVMPPWQASLQRLMAWSGSGPMIVLSRCLLTPLEMPISLLAGASRRSFRSFLVWDLLGEALYVLGYLALGHAGGTLASSWPLLLAFGLLATLLSVSPLLLARWLTGRRSGSRTTARTTHRRLACPTAQTPCQVTCVRDTARQKWRIHHSLCRMRDAQRARWAVAASRERTVRPAPAHNA